MKNTISENINLIINEFNRLKEQGLDKFVIAGQHAAAMWLLDGHAIEPFKGFYLREGRWAGDLVDIKFTKVI